MPRAKFNHQRRFLDKWQMHVALEDAHIPGLHLPATWLLQHFTISDFMRCNSWYVKPIHTWGGHQIARCDKDGKWYQFHVQGQSAITLSSPGEALAVMRAQFDPSTAIVQQSAPVTNLQGHPFDVRVLYQRELDDTWVMAGALTRVGAKDSIVSNVGTGRGHVLPIKSALAQLYRGQALRRKTMAQLSQISLAICQMLDSYYEFDEVGMDFGLTRQGHVWLFEVNTNDALGGPSHELFKMLPDQRIYQRIEARSERQKERWLATLAHDLEMHATKD